MPILKWGLAVGAGTALGLFLFSYVFLLKQIRLPRAELIGDPSQLGLPFESIRLETEDGLRLAGWWIPASPNQPTILMVHGLGANRSDLLGIAAGLSRAGFNLLMIDLRAHGESEGKITSYGYWEQKDFKSALDFLDTHARVNMHVYGVYAVSMGGAAAMVYAARDPRVRALVVDSSFDDLGESMNRHLKLFWGLPPAIFGWFAHRAYELRFRTPISTISPKRAVSQFAPRPIFIIAGGMDPRLPVEEARRLFEQAKDPKEFWLVPEAEHAGAFDLFPKEYEERVGSFFRKHLGQSSN